jgi:hypothetical protein
MYVTRARVYAYKQASCLLCLRGGVTGRPVATAIRIE